MTGVSFYDIDYIIATNERRLAEYKATYQKTIDKFTHLLIIYSAIAIYLVPVVQQLVFAETGNWCYLVCFAVFAALFLVSLVFAVKLLIPAEESDLLSPKIYYIGLRKEYEGMMLLQEEINEQLKASYIKELERAVNAWLKICMRKKDFYREALTYGLLSALPFLVCLAIYLYKKGAEQLKENGVKSQNFINFNYEENIFIDKRLCLIYKGKKNIEVPAGNKFAA